MIYLYYLRNILISSLFILCCSSINIPFYIKYIVLCKNDGIYSITWIHNQGEDTQNNLCIDPYFPAHRGIFFPAPIDLKPNGRPVGSKSNGKWYIQSDFGLV